MRHRTRLICTVQVVSILVLVAIFFAERSWACSKPECPHATANAAALSDVDVTSLAHSDSAADSESVASVGDVEANPDLSNHLSTASVHGGDEYRWPASTAAHVYSGICAQGFSFQGMSYGASVATGNSVCDFVAVTGNYLAVGAAAPGLLDEDGRSALEKAMRAADEAFGAARRRNRLSRIRNYLTLGLF